MRESTTKAKTTSGIVAHSAILAKWKSRILSQTPCAELTLRVPPVANYDTVLDGLRQTCQGHVDGASFLMAPTALLSK
jgi:hypothetical protein